MAESLLFGVAESFITKLASHAVKEAALALNVYDDLQEIKDIVSFITSVLLDAELKQHQNNELLEWLKQVKRIFSNAEGVIDDFECEALRKHVVNASGNTGRKVQRFFSSSNPLVYRVRMAHQIKNIKHKLDKVAAHRQKFGLQTIDGVNRVVKSWESHSHVNDFDVIGREHDKHKIMELLLQHLHSDDKDRLSIIPIVGIGGLGKTTLAKSVYNDIHIMQCFEYRMWVCVSNDVDIKNVLIKILNSTYDNPIQQEKFNNLTMEQVQSHLRHRLASRRFFLVLDDIWNDDHVKWEDLKDIIPVGERASGSTILVTTRSHAVANMMGTHSPQILQGLSREDSLSLFLKWAFKEGEEKGHPELMKIGEDIVRKCGGIPLALRTLGSSLSKEVDIQRWMFVRDNEIWKLPQKEGDILSALKLSYDRLPFHLKRCFACFSLFEKDRNFASFDITALWEALGFLPSSKQGEIFLHELWSTSFLQEFVDYGSISYFKLNGLVHDLALYVARDEFKVLKSNGESISESVLHLSFNKSDLLGQTQIPTSLRTILLPDQANKAFMNTLVSRCKYLRILHLTNSTHESLPHSIGKLKQLRYLNLQCNVELKRLPESVCKLQNLQTLNLFLCEGLQTLPKGIGNLINLQRLFITTKQSEFPDKEIAKLKYLEFLSIRSCCNFESLFGGIELPSLKSLTISYCGNLKSLSLQALPNLESLAISGCNKLALSMAYHNQIPKLRLKSLSFEDSLQLVTFPQWIQGCANTLQFLTIRGCENLVELPKWLSTLTCLKSITIDNCSSLVMLHDDLHHLPNLEYLKSEGCPELCRRYQPGVGQDWPKISHIKQITIKSLEPEN